MAKKEKLSPQDAILIAYEELGVKKVTYTTYPNLSESGPCPECEEMDGEVFTLEEAYGILPMHPNCCCHFTSYNPANPRNKSLYKGTMNNNIKTESADKSLGILSKHNNNINLVQCKSLPVTCDEEMARKIDELVETLPQDCKEVKYKSVDAKYQIENDERTEVSVISTSQKDQQGEIFPQEGIFLDYYTSRKVKSVLYYHDWTKKAAENRWVKLVGGVLKAKTKYPVDSPHTNAELSEQCWRMVTSNPPLCKGKSIGVIPLEPGRDPSKEELEVNPSWEGGRVFPKLFMLEYSLTDIPVNDAALLEAVKTKSLDEKIMREVFGVELAKEELVVKSEPEDDISKKIKWLNDTEPGKYTDKQVAALAYAIINKHKVKSLEKTVDVFTADQIQKSLDRLIAKLEKEFDSSADCRKILNRIKEMRS